MDCTVPLTAKAADTCKNKNITNMSYEMIDSIAVLVAWMECIFRNTNVKNEIGVGF